MKELVNQFLFEINEKYPWVEIVCDELEDGTFDIKYFDENLDQDEEFKEIVGNLLYKHFYSKCFYDFYFGYEIQKTYDRFTRTCEVDVFLVNNKYEEEYTQTEETSNFSVKISLKQEKKNLDTYKCENYSSEYKVELDEMGLVA